jgi:hypothetical protein
LIKFLDFHFFSFADEEKAAAFTADFAAIEEIEPILILVSKISLLLPFEAPLRSLLSQGFFSWQDSK